MNTAVISIIGAGNMGSNLIGGLIRNGYSPDKLWACDLNEEKLAVLKREFNIHTTTHNSEAVQAANVIIFAVKPQFFAQAAREAANVIQSTQPLVISVAAGIRVASIEHWLGGEIAIVRAMPNTPALLGCGATALFANTRVTHARLNLAESILRAVGVAVWVPHEPMMDTVTALSGSGPAYFFLVMEAMQQAAEQLGLPPDTARLLTLQTAMGATRMAIESGSSLIDLRRHVTSPGGTTEKGVSVLEENNIRDLFMKTLEAAKLRSEELANILGEDK